MSINPYVGQLVVLRSRWSLGSKRLGIVIDCSENSDELTVMWTISRDKIDIRIHIQDALLPVADLTVSKIKERV